mmetsp:Transcript_5299/g.8197  ORF Transcript_5299/g.8197 Transcript_5299/m.8197 type:complete len:233 (+) Transcript_5299:291-989(+)
MHTVWPPIKSAHTFRVIERGNMLYSTSWNTFWMGTAGEFFSFVVASFVLFNRSDRLRSSPTNRGIDAKLQLLPTPADHCLSPVCFLRGNATGIKALILRSVRSVGVSSTASRYLVTAPENAASKTSFTLTPAAFFVLLTRDSGTSGIATIVLSTPLAPRGVSGRRIVTVSRRAKGSVNTDVVAATRSNMRVIDGAKERSFRLKGAGGGTGSPLRSVVNPWKAVANDNPSPMQ